MVDRSLALHTAATGFATLLFTGAFALAAAALVAPWLSVSPFLLAIPIVAIALVVQVRYVRHDLLAGTGARVVDREAFPDLYRRLDRLSQGLDAPTARLAVVDSDTPNSCSVAGAGRGTVVVSTGLLDACSDDELDAVLAHELAHLRNRDATVLTAAAFLPALVNGDYSLWRDLGLDDAPGARTLVAVGGGVALYALAAPSLPGPALSATSLGSFVVGAGAVLLLGGVVLGVLATPVVFLARSLSRTREFAADRAAARLTGSPATLATLLERLGDATAAPTADARDAAQPTARRERIAGLHGLCFLPGGFDAPDDASVRDAESGTVDADDATDADDAADPFGFRVETRSHPPAADRVTRLRDLAAAMERGEA
ncbi:M48 family metalloprotease [Halobaculum marinum]|uniref:M48 family metalloprotease n=1 Tax=Halobaculum marinum TaxID=3031996 RepID=A0ABD5WZH8_9EURY|nr:M48 family metalloprotease [Halobaculum sp. DT55]